MKPVIIATCALLIAGLAGPSQAQLTLNTTFAAGNGQSGNMFDLEATGGSPLRIQSFDVHTSGVVTIEVYVVTAGTSYVGNDLNPGAWTLLATVPNITGAGIGLPTPLNLTLNYPLPPNTRTGFYVTTTAGTLQYTNGTNLGARFASDANLTFYEGIGKAYPFLSNFSPRIFNGNIHYGLGNNILSIAQTGVGVGDLLVSIGMLSPTAFEGWIVLSTETSQPVGTGPLLGIHPDVFTWTILTYPYFPGNPFHFRTTDAGLFPQVTYYAPPGSVSPLLGQTMDFVGLMFNSSFQFDSATNVVRVMFQ